MNIFKNPKLTNRSQSTVTEFHSKALNYKEKVNYIL